MDHDKHTQFTKFIVLSLDKNRSSVICKKIEVTYMDHDKHTQITNMLALDIYSQQYMYITLVR
jgi:hypothetical protein